MPKNDEGEFELILGNRQLLSVFFIVVVLLGVFFTMGYIVGRNSGPIVSADAAPAHQAVKPLVVESAAPSAPTAAPAVESAPPKETTPQRAAPEPKIEPVKEIKPAAPAAAASSGESPMAGQTFLQLAATSQREADIEVDVLRKKGFKALAIEKPDQPGTFRVLVGPLADGALNKTKSDLQAAGFPGDKAIRRTF